MHQSFPHTRGRRTRQAPWIRNLVQEHTLSAKDLIWPLFIQDSDQAYEAIPSMPDVNRLNLESLIQAAKEAVKLGIPAIALFPVIEAKDKDDWGTEALNPNNLMCRAIRALKAENLDLGIITDVALDPYTTHGHDGVLEKGSVLNDKTVAILKDMSLVLAEAGADVIAPSDMMDGRVGAIREALEAEGFHNTLILSYAAKYASCFYGPFRSAVGSSGNLTDGKKDDYQMAYPNTDEALHEVAMDLEEGADMVMIKPGMPYLDIVHRVKNRFQKPTFAYQVSGEYAMLHHYAQTSGQDLHAVFLESLMAFKRAGADGIFTYAAPLMANYLQKA